MPVGLGKRGSGRSSQCLYFSLRKELEAWAWLGLAEPGWACGIYSSLSKPGSVNSFRRWGRQEEGSNRAWEQKALGSLLFVARLLERRQDGGRLRGLVWWWGCSMEKEDRTFLAASPLRPGSPAQPQVWEPPSG